MRLWLEQQLLRAMCTLLTRVGGLLTRAYAKMLCNLVELRSRPAVPLKVERWGLLPWALGRRSARYPRLLSRPRSPLLRFPRHFVFSVHLLASMLFLSSR